MIRLFIDHKKDCWMAEFDDTNTEVLQLFGTYILPTPFLASVPAAEVVSEIQKRNPDQLVILKGVASGDDKGFL